MKKIIFGVLLSLFVVGNCYGLDPKQIVGTYTGKGCVVTITHKGGNNYYVKMKNTRVKDCEFEGESVLKNGELDGGDTVGDIIYGVELKGNGKISVMIPRVTDPSMCFPYEDLTKKK